MIELEKYIGIPFVDKGRTLDGADCYGIVKLYYKEFLNIDIEEIIANPDNAKSCFVKYLDQISRNWKQENHAVKNSVVAMSTNPQHPNMITHFGVMIDDKRMLHTFKNVQCHVICIDNPIIKTQIKGFYSWSQL